MSYYLAKSLATLRAQIDAKWPNRSKSSDGWIGDASHAAGKSDHNPDYVAGGVVRAIDVTASGINANALIKAAIKDPRTNYVIHKGIIRGASKFRKRKYTGSNPHTHHVHISIKHTGAAENGRAWKLKGSGAVGTVNPATSTKPTKTKYARLSVDGKAGAKTVSALQLLMSTRAVHTYTRAIDGKFGKHTVIAVQEWLRGLGYYPSSRYVIDGKFGPATVKGLQRFLVKKGHLNGKKWRIDGDFGKQTVKALQRYLNAQRKYV
ncbi:peptidoglycan-binding domain-containing protein [Arthrobacter rhombi]|uniref:peptidoglycan-binding domain-containing protein n=1 Tax=Arthrobacter rhombi TaxID=71253 RepID=UPI003FD64AA5